MSNLYTIGTLGTVPELRFSASGTAWVTARVAVERRVKDKDNGEWKSETDWYNLKAFGTTAENLAQSADKGQRLMIFGSLQTETYQDKKTGEQRESQTIVADDVGIDLRFVTATVQRSVASQGRSNQQQSQASSVDRGYANHSQEPF